MQAIYLDDEQSGYLIEDNVCEDSMTCYFVGGGRDNIVRNNVCKNVGTCMHLDNRGLNWQHDSCVINATWTYLPQHVFGILAEDTLTTAIPISERGEILVAFMFMSFGGVLTN